MKIYKPTYDRGWRVDVFDSDNIRLINETVLCQWNPKVGCYGRTFLIDEPFFYTEDDAWLYINKGYVPPEGRFTQFKKRGA